MSTLASASLRVAARPANPAPITMMRGLLDTEIPFLNSIYNERIVRSICDKSSNLTIFLSFYKENGLSDRLMSVL
jgi:hypothetical protein